MFFRKYRTFFALTETIRHAGVTAFQNDCPLFNFHFCTKIFVFNVLIAVVLVMLDYQKLT